MPLGLIIGLGRAMRRKRLSSLNILSSKRGPRDYYKGKNCKPTGFHTRKGGYVVQDEKLPRYVVPDLTDFKLKPYVSQCARDSATDPTEPEPKIKTGGFSKLKTKTKPNKLDILDFTSFRRFPVIYWRVGRFITVE
ncbi:hypothetical protein AXF42_Ash000964 [Apostasia shenzhenica]|uniref:39S ribosomal protein L41-A, mitochondrial n=1 Tax=Apostasia shenzhenica TaxID=1088818 RepID=A0A2I0ATK1_9ASPA|nr:hypothetical protein AXF42_Ash000964 [Apostasia shenzhenica]